MVGSTEPRAIGFNHIALEVGDIEEAATRAESSISLTVCKGIDRRRLGSKHANGASGIRLLFLRSVLVPHGIPGLAVFDLG